MHKKKIFITGMGGMIGSHLALTAFKQGYPVTGTLNKNIPEFLKGLIKQNKVSYYSTDLLQPQEIKRALSDYQPDVIVNLAGKVLSRRDGEKADVKIYKENITMLKNLISAVKLLPKKPKLIYVSGCLVYDKSFSPDFISELPVKDLPSISSKKEPYRASRIDQEKLLEKEKALNYILVRPTQITGPGKIPGVVEYFIAKEIYETLNNPKKSDILIGNKLAEVDFIDVRDVVDALIILIEKSSNRSIYHLSSGSPISIEKLIKTFLSALNLKPDKYQIVSGNPEEISYFRFSSDKLKKLGWKPKINLKDTLKNYYDYFEKELL